MDGTVAAIASHPVTHGLSNEYWVNLRNALRRACQTGDEPVSCLPGEAMTSYVADAPISNPAEDRFHRWPFAKRIADTIATRNDPSSLVVAIHGAWGDGKTTVLNFVDRELSSLQNAVVIRFNPWRYPDEVALLHSFFATLARALETKVATRKEELGQALAKYATFIDFVKSGVGSAAKAAGELLGNIDIEEEKRRVAEILVSNQKMVVILMDDIDRLEKTEIQAVFKLVKLTGDFENVSYVLAFDAEMVANAIGERFTAIENERAQAGQSFLEKIVQVPLDLPAIPRSALGRFAFEAIDEALRTAGVQLTESQSHDFAQIFSDGIGIRLKTPRMAKRYANAIAFALGINKGEVHEVDMMLIEGIRVFYPNAYQALKHNRQVLTERSDSALHKRTMPERRAELKAEIGRGLQPDEAKSLLKLLQFLFPRYGETLYGPDFEEEWAKQKRVASPEYFDRYFTYSVPEGDIPDHRITSLLSGLESNAVDATASMLKDIVTPSTAALAIRKLRSAVDELSQNSAKNLAMAVARSGDLFPETDTFLYPADPSNQAAMLISRLLRQIDQQSRLAVAEALAREAEPLPFACRVVRWISSGQDTPPENRRLAPDEDVVLWGSLAGRILGYVQSKGSRVFEEPRHAAMYFELLGRGGRDADARQFLEQDFRQSPSDAILFVSGFLPISYSSLGTKPSEFERNTYERVGRLVAPSLLHDCMVKVFGSEVANPVYNGSSDRSLSATIAHQFEYVHKQVTAELTGTIPASLEPCTDSVEPNTHDSVAG